MIEVYPFSTAVNLNEVDYSGSITGLSIRDGRVTYEISYWENGSYKTNWFCEHEFKTLAKKSDTIGFKEPTLCHTIQSPDARENIYTQNVERVQESNKVRTKLY